MKLCCQNCDTVIELDENKTVGCGCDPDAPTWIGITKDGRVLSMSYAHYEIMPKDA